MNKPKVFVIYSWEDNRQQELVLAFVNKLRKNGIDAEFDRIKTQSETAIDFFEMMNNAIVNSDKIIIVLSEGYKAKAENFKDGVGFEYRLLMKDIDKKPKKYIVISFEELRDEITPLFLIGRDAIDMNKSNSFNLLYSKLLDKSILNIADVSDTTPEIFGEDIQDFETLLKKGKGIAPITDTQANHREIKVMKLLKNAESKLKVAEAKKHYQNILSNYKILNENEQFLPSLRLQAHIELVKLVSQPKKRKEYWHKMLKLVHSSINKYSDNKSLIKTSIDLIVDYLQDDYINKDYIFLKKTLALAKGKLNSLIKNEPLDHRHNLLTKKAKVLRNTSNLEVTQSLVERRAREAVGCIEKALSIEKSWYAYLELGNCLLNLSKLSKKEIEFKHLIERTEEAYWKSCNLQLNSRNTITLCRFYRSTYQYTPFLSAFKLYEEVETNRLKYLDNSNIFAEVTISIYYSGHPDEPLKELISKSTNLIEKAIDIGLVDARKIVSLSFLKACNGEISVGQEILNTIKLGESFSWNSFLADIEIYKKSDDLFSKGFILGIDNPSIWNKIGTFVLDFLGDHKLAQKLYDVSLLHNPTNPVTLTNKARLLTLFYSNDNDKILEAETLVSKAASQSNFRFQWWREVRHDIMTVQNKASEKKHFIPITKRTNTSDKLNLRNKRELIRAFYSLTEINDFNVRRKQFEAVVKKLITNTISNKYNYFVYDNKQKFKDDRMFYFEKDFYKFLVLWEEDKIKLDKLIPFWLDIKDKEMGGLCISGNEFDSSVIEFLKENENHSNLILINKNEIEMALTGKTPLDEIIRIKQIFKAYENNPYYVIENAVSNLQKGNVP